MEIKQIGVEKYMEKSKFIEIGVCTQCPVKSRNWL